MLARSEIDALFPADLPEPGHWEQLYPPRELPEGAMVTRFAPSPTGFLHIGGVYSAMIDRDLAVNSAGVYFVRVEDTDQARGVEGAAEQFGRAFTYFSVEPTEDELIGKYGPYLQSERLPIYLTYIRELLYADKAYLCFATKDEIAAITARQQANKVPTGYYGDWAIWRNATDEQVREALAEGRPYVIRFRSPGNRRDRVSYTDLIRGRIEAEDNVNDVVIRKASDLPLPLPTYHFAHAVDDHLMRVDPVIRADEWIASVPLHLQLCTALGFEQFRYAHIAPLLKQEGGGKRKLSKRKDPEASVDYYIDAGYPAEAVLYYLRGLANGRLAEMPLAEALSTPISLAEAGVSGALLDLVKLDNISASHIATLSGEQILNAVLPWAKERDKELAAAIEGDREIALDALKIEREGVDNPRKDLRKWADFRETYAYFFPGLYTNPVLPDAIAAIGAPAIDAFIDDLTGSYQDLSDPQEWFEQIRSASQRTGFARTPKEAKAEPEKYHGSIREASQIVRVALTGSTRSPDLFQVAQVLGHDEVLRRIRLLKSA